MKYKLESLLNEIMAFIQDKDLGAGYPDKILKIKKVVEKLPLHPTEEQINMATKEWQQIKETV